MHQCDTKVTMKTHSLTNKRECNCVYHCVCENQNTTTTNCFNARFHCVNITFVKKRPYMFNLVLFQVCLNDMTSQSFHCKYVT